MSGLVKIALIGAGIISAAIGLSIVNDIYKEKHGKSIPDAVGEAVEKHPVAATVVATTVVIAGSILAHDAMESYQMSHRTPEWYALEEEKARARAQMHAADLEDRRKRDEAERLAAEKKRMDELDFYRQMPGEYWAYRSSVEDRRAREKEANSIVQSSKYVSDNELEATKYVSDNDLEAKIVKVKANEAKEKKEEKAS